MTVNFGLLAVMALTSFRLTWLVVRDSFPPIRWVREQLVELHWRHAEPVEYRDMEESDTQYVDYRGPWSWPAELITCHWCVSVWTSAGVTVIADATIGLAQPWLYFGATSGIAALIAQGVAAIVDRE